MSDPAMDLRVDTNPRLKRPDGVLIEPFVEVRCDCNEWVEFYEVDVVSHNTVTCTCGTEWELGAEKV